MARRKTKAEKYARNKELVRTVESEGVSFQASFSSKLATKMRILRAYGYEYLYSSKDSIRLDECSDARITHALKHTYENAKKQVEKFEATLRASEEYKNLVSLIEAEEELSGDELEEAVERTAILMDSAPEPVLYLLSDEYGVRVLGQYYRPQA